MAPTASVQVSEDSLLREASNGDGVIGNVDFYVDSSAIACIKLQGHRTTNITTNTVLSLKASPYRRRLASEIPSRHQTGVKLSPISIPILLQFAMVRKRILFGVRFVCDPPFWNAGYQAAFQILAISKSLVTLIYTRYWCLPQRTAVRRRAIPKIGDSLG